MRVVKVHKTRTRYTVDGCMAELAEVIADGKHTIPSLWNWKMLRR